MQAKLLDLEPVTCESAIEEARKNLTEKYPAAVADLDRLLPLIKMEATVISGSVPSEIRKKDHPIFLSAVASKAKYLVTGDHRDFGKWIDKPSGPADNLLVVSPAWLFDKLVPKAN